MTATSFEQQPKLSLELEAQRIQELLEPFKESVDTTQWTNLGINSGGFLTATVPLSHINRSSFPINHEHSAGIAREMSEEAEKTGGTGQRDSINLVTVIDEKGLEITDGFHRHDATVMNGHDVIHAVLTPLITKEELLDMRIAATRKFDLELARVVELAQEAWDLTEWSEMLDVISAFHMEATHAKGRIYGLDAAQRQQISDWMKDKETRWNLSAEQVHRHLKNAEDHEPEIVAEMRQLGDHRDLGFTPKVANKVVPKFTQKICGEEYIETDLVILIAQCANRLKLTHDQTVQLADQIYASESYEDAAQLAMTFEPSNIPPKPVPKKPIKPPKLLTETAGQLDHIAMDDTTPVQPSDSKTIEDIIKNTPNHDLVHVLGRAVSAIKDRHRKGDIVDNSHNKAQLQMLAKAILNMAGESNPNGWGVHRGTYATNQLAHEAAARIATYILEGGTKKPDLPVQQSTQTKQIFAEVGRILSGSPKDENVKRRIDELSEELRRRFPVNQ